MIEHQFDSHSGRASGSDSGSGSGSESGSGSGSAVSGPPALLDALRHTAELLAETDWASAPGTVNHEVATVLAGVRNTLDAVEAENLAAEERSGAWRVRGARSFAAHRAYELRLPVADVRRSLRRGRALRAMAATRDALACGAISARHADRLARAHRPEVADAFTEDEAGLVEEARRRPFAEWDRLVDRWEQAADPDRGEPTADAQASRRELHASHTIGGMGRLDGWLDPLGMAEFTTELDRIERRLFEQDWNDARAVHGDRATKNDLARTARQRRADALVEMACRSASCDLDGPAPAPGFVVNIHTDQVTLLDTLARLTGVDPAELPTDLEPGWGMPAGHRFCETAAGTTVAPSDMLLAAVCGRVRRVLYDADGELIDHGRARRLFTGALRDAVIARSRTCAAPDCELPAFRCEIDHRRSWADGGHTDARNGQPVCDRDNRWKQRHPELWRRLLDEDRHRRRGSGSSDDRRGPPPSGDPPAPSP
jgi:hypothetical protein